MQLVETVAFLRHRGRGSWPGSPKSRMCTGFAGSDRSYTCVMRRDCHPFTPDTRYAMPVSHSHQLLCVSRSPRTTVVTSPVSRAW